MVLYKQMQGVIITVPGNPDYTYGKKIEELPPYMLYGDRSIRENPLGPEEVITKDLEYLQGMYPGHMKRLQEYVVSACDHLDYKDSPMYDEFPDRLLIHQICDSICVKIREEGIITDDGILGTDDRGQMDVEASADPVEWGDEVLEKEDTDRRYSTWGPPSGPWGPPGSTPPYWGPGSRSPYWGPGSKSPYWGPPRDNKPPYRGPGWGTKPPYWSGKPGPSRNNSWLNDIVSVLLLNEMHRRRCRTGRCR